MIRLITLSLFIVSVAACAPYELARYAASPDAPAFTAGERIRLAGLDAVVTVSQRGDGLYRIEAGSERDAALAQGYLMARDRMAQLDLLRHLARGELAALLGERDFGQRSSLETDVLNRFLGFRERGRQVLAATSADEREVLDAYVAGVNAWIDVGHLSLEHRLLGVAVVRPWTAEDSMAIYAMLMHGLSGNADREIRRLAIACNAGLEAVDRLWPMDLEFASYALPEADLRPSRYPRQRDVAPELAAALQRLCPPARERRSGVAPLAGIWDLFADGWSASNNWALGSGLSQSGRSILSSDPHLPHMNPPLAWGVEVKTPAHHVAGFVLPGMHRVVFGHNGRVAWGATTNHVDRQDLVVYEAQAAVIGGERVEGYRVDGAFLPFEPRTETFAVRGGDPVTVTVRMTRDGPLLNDIDPTLAGLVPLVAQRRAPVLQGRDLDGARAINVAGNVAEFSAGIEQVDLGCSSWLFADAEGSIAFRSPCVVPVREGWSGAFPVPGWSTRYDWRRFYAKDELPSSTNPSRQWLATANNQIVPSRRFPTTYNADVSAPDRFERIAWRLQQDTAAMPMTAASSATIQLDRYLQPWRAIRASLPRDFCAPGATRERALVCAWDGEMGPDSAAATLFTLWTNALLDHALADEFREGAADPAWHFVQSLPQFEVRAAFLWRQPAEDPVWDDVRTPERERREDILEAAFTAAVATARRRFGDDPDGWGWGEVRPFVLRHAFAGDDGVPGWFLNSRPVPVGGGNETVFKNQFTRADRERMDPLIGPIVRFSVDLGDPWAATYTLAGGQSGWPMSSHYGDLLGDWAVGRGRPLTPAAAAADVTVRLEP